VTLWIKICGLTTEEGVSAAVDAGADAIGFVFAPSKRQVSADRAARLARAAPTHVTRVAVMQHPTQQLLDDVWNVLRPDVLQTDIEDLEQLRIPIGLNVNPVIRSGRSLPQTMPSRLLFEGAVSGTGSVTDWSAAAKLASRTQLILAGGLSSANVAQAVAMVRPFGIDVSTGVENAPGIKDPDKIREFVRVARAAAAVQLSGVSVG
jgi:phosphoribosylanthranilate isomerase